MTIPHKLRVQPFLDELTDSARKIGAVNTITPRPALVTSRTTLGGSNVLTGDNTDWIGICDCISKALRKRSGSDHGACISGRERRHRARGVLRYDSGTAR